MRVYRWLAAALIGFAFYGSLLPFRLRPEPLGAAWSTFIAIIANPSPESISRTNFLANVLLFVPIGFVLMGARLADRRAHPLTIGVTAAAMLTFSLLVSTLIEFLQVFTPRRIPALSDIIAQGVGSAIGLTAWIAAGTPLTAWLRETAQRHRDDRLTRALMIYAALWLFAGLAPFDISFDLGRLARRFRTGMITFVPFGSPAPLGRQIWDAAATTLTSIPLGMFSLVVRQPPGTRRRAWLAWPLGAAAILGLEAAQIFIGFHAADVTDVLFGWIGVAIGVVAGARVLGRTAAPHSFSSGTRLAALAVMCAWALVVCGFHWQPFDFSVDPGLVREKLEQVSLIPFAGYQTGAELNAFTNLISKAGVALPLGVCAAYAIGSASPLVISVLWVMIATAFFGGVELAQLFIPSRFPDPTDVLVGVVSSLTGLWLGRWFRDQGSGIRVPDP
jgi:VanZ family protein